MSRIGRYRDEYFRKDGRQSDEFLCSDTRYSDEFVRTNEYSYTNETELMDESFFHNDEFNLESETNLREGTSGESDFEAGGEEIASQTTTMMGVGTVKIGAITTAAIMSVSTVALNHEHNFANGWSVFREASCHHAGIETLVCSDCGWAVEKRETPTLEHMISDWIEQNSTGTKVKSCLDCGQVIETSPISSSDNDNESNKPNQNEELEQNPQPESSSSSEIIEEQEEISSSSEVEQEESSSNSEVEEEEESSSSSEVEEESSSSSLSVVVPSIDIELTPEENTTPEEMCKHETAKITREVIREPTCTTEGIAQFVCSCGEYSYTESIVTIPHLYNGKEICSVCQQMCNHSDNNGTCTECGKELYRKRCEGDCVYTDSSYSVCDNCNCPPKCEQCSYNAYGVCDRCGSPAESQPIECTECGDFTYNADGICDACQKVEETDCDHTMWETVEKETPATCTEKGVVKGICGNPNCGGTIYEEELEPTGHQYADGVCGCGAECINHIDDDGDEACDTCGTPLAT